MQQVLASGSEMDQVGKDDCGRLGDLGGGEKNSTPIDWEAEVGPGQVEHGLENDTGKEEGEEASLLILASSRGRTVGPQSTGRLLYSRLSCSS